MVGVGGARDAVELRHGFAGGFFAHDMATGVEGRNAGNRMQGLGQGIDKEIEPPDFDHFLPVPIGFGAELFAGIAPPFGQLIRNRYDFEFVGHLAQPVGVNIIPTAALPPNGNANDVVVRHRFPFFGLWIQGALRRPTSAGSASPASASHNTLVRQSRQQ